MKSKLALFLTTLMLSQLLFSCAGNPAEEPAADTTAAQTTETSAPAESETEEPPLSDDIPEIDFGGEDFVFLTTDLPNLQHAITTVTESNGEVLNDTMYQRTMDTAQKYNIVFQDDIATKSSNDAITMFRNSVSAQDEAYDVAMLLERRAFAMVKESFFQDISALPHVDIAKPYWESDINDVINFTDELYIAYGSVVLSLYDMTHILLFNQKMLESLQLENPFDLVLEGTWTLDKMTEMGQAARQDTNGDGTWGAEDIYGVVGASNALPMNFITSSGARTLETQADGTVSVMLLENPRIEEVFTKVCDIFWDPGFWYTKSTNSNNYWLSETQFQTDQALFADHTFFSVSTLRDMESNFGIIPFPKFDAEQTDYYAMVEAGSRIMTVPVTNKNTEMTGAVLETLNFLTYRDVIPAYYEVTLKQKVSRDNVSSKMLDLIMDSIHYDLGATMLNDNVKDGIFTTLFKNNRRQYASYSTKMKPAIEKALADVRGE